MGLGTPCKLWGMLLIHNPHSSLVHSPPSPPWLTIPTLYWGTICLHSSPTPGWSCRWRGSQDYGTGHRCQTTQVAGSIESHQGDLEKASSSSIIGVGGIWRQASQSGLSWGKSEPNGRHLLPKCAHSIHRDVNKCSSSHHSLKTYGSFHCKPPDLSDSLDFWS